MSQLIMLNPRKRKIFRNPHEDHEYGTPASRLKAWKKSQSKKGKRKSNEEDKKTMAKKRKPKKTSRKRVHHRKKTSSVKTKKVVHRSSSHKRKKGKSHGKARRHKAHRGNLVIPAFFKNPRHRKVRKNPRRRITSMFKSDLVKNSVVGGIAFIGSLMLPKVLKITDWKKYLISGGIAIASMTVGKKILGKHAQSIAVGSGVAVVVNLINDFFLKSQNQSVLSDDLSADSSLDLISAGGEFDIVNGAEDLDTMSGANEIAITD